MGGRRAIGPVAERVSNRARDSYHALRRVCRQFVAELPDDRKHGMTSPAADRSTTASSRSRSGLRPSRFVRPLVGVAIAAAVAFGCILPGCESSPARRDSEWPRLFSSTGGALPEPFDLSRVSVHGVGEAPRHHVVRGDTFYSVSRRYGVSVESLLALNPAIAPESLEVGQWLVLPASAASSSKAAVRSVVSTAPTPKQPTPKRETPKK